MLQLLMYGDVYNLCKLNNFFYYLIYVGDVEVFKEKCLSSYEFLQYKLLVILCRY